MAVKNPDYLDYSVDSVVRTVHFISSLIVLIPHRDDVRDRHRRVD